MFAKGEKAAVRLRVKRIRGRLLLLRLERLNRDWPVHILSFERKDKLANHDAVAATDGVPSALRTKSMYQPVGVRLWLVGIVSVAPVAVAVAASVTEFCTVLPPNGLVSDTVGNPLTAAVPSKNRPLTVAPCVLIT